MIFTYVYRSSSRHIAVFRSSPQHPAALPRTSSRWCCAVLRGTAEKSYVLRKAAEKMLVPLANLLVLRKIDTLVLLKELLVSRTM